MLPLLWQGVLTLISHPRCPACGCASGPDAEPFGPPADGALCGGCLEALALPAVALSGEAPIPWRALAPYGGRLRQLLLRQRPDPRRELIQALARLLHRRCIDGWPAGLLVPIPSWKRAANPLPSLLALELARLSPHPTRSAPELLRRCRATVGQHHLNRRQRLINQHGSFSCGVAGRGSVWLVDDILTTGATATAAAAALAEAGWRVQGVLCLGRTPGPEQAVI